MSEQQLTLLDAAGARGRRSSSAQETVDAALPREERPVTPAQMTKWQQDAARAQAAVAEMNLVFQRAAVRGLTFCQLIQLWK